MNASTDGADSAPLFGRAVTARTSIRRFARANAVVAMCALVILVVVTLLAVDDALMWLMAGALAAAICMLAFAAHSADEIDPLTALALITGANWLVALLTPVALPFLWPAMAIVAVLPLVLAAPFVSLRTLSWMIALAAGVTAGVAAIGLEGDDGGAIPDIGDEVELAVVIGVIAVLMVPIGLVVWLNNRSQQEALDEALRLNAELGRSEARLAASRRRVVEAGDAARSRIERDLHDGAQQQIVALGMKTRLLASQLPDDAPPQTSALVTSLVGDVDRAVESLRELAHGIYPPVLEAHGVGQALDAAARRAVGGRIVVDDRLGGLRLGRVAEEALYFTALEAITNATKHAPGSEVTVSISLADDGMAELTATDDGPGFDPAAIDASRGLTNMADRVESIGGSFAIGTADSGGTIVRASVPLD